MPEYNYHFSSDDLNAALSCLDEYGFCVIRQLIDEDLVCSLKKSVDLHLDPDRDLSPASNRYHMAFAEDSEVIWNLIDNPEYMRFIQAVHGTEDLCLHRSAAILRTAGEGMGRWHMDHRGHIDIPQRANDVLNRFPMPSGAWFYLNGSHPDRSGIAVIEKSHDPDWKGPKGYAIAPEKGGICPEGETMDRFFDGLSVPGCVPVLADPGDLICFADLTWHVNMATHERRYSCGMGFRPKEWPVNAPWALPDSAAALMAKLPDRFKRYMEGYVGFDGSWEAKQPGESEI